MSVRAAGAGKRRSRGAPAAVSLPIAGWTADPAGRFVRCGPDIGRRPPGLRCRATADFTKPRERPGPISEIPIPPDSPVQREWSLVCDAPDLPACVTGWEHPGQDAVPDAGRIFEALWSVDPAVVRSATMIAAGFAEAASPGRFAPLQARLAEPAAAGSADLHRVSGLLERTLDYLTRRWAEGQGLAGTPPGAGPESRHGTAYRR